MEYKYKAELEALVNSGFSMPTVVMPNNKKASRFVFAHEPSRNHLPVCVANPRRLLPGGIRTSGYALSCFGDPGKAKERYIALQANFRRIRQTIGDSLASGIISNDDGRITTEDKNTSHFDLYESKLCDLNKTFTIITEL